MIRTVLASFVLAALAVTPTGHAGGQAEAPAAGSAARSIAYAPPVAGRVLRPFELPRTRFGAGHRGVDLATTSGQAVRAAADGVVTFAGVLAGRGVVVIAHPDGVRTEYEPVRVAVRVGDSVRRGSLIGRVAGTHGGCAPHRCLHWGARRGDAYVDPLTLLRGLGRVHLVPWSSGG